MAVAAEDKAAEFKAQWLEAKKRNSDLQNVVDSFAKERKKFQDAEDANAALKDDLAEAKAQNEILRAQLKSAHDNLASANKALDKAQAQVDAAQKLKEGLAALG
jgi:predicted RNase H-like nuclease (RuvC/YqgF family)